VYSRDLAFVHDAAFSDLSRRAAPEIVRILRDSGLTSGRVVEVGCGSGVLARRLCAAGYDVVGFDVSPAMIKLARAQAPAARFRVANAAKTAVPACDAVVGIGEVVTYLPGGLAALRRFFGRVYDALAPGGVFIFDFMHTARGRTYPLRTVGTKQWSMAVRATYNRQTRVLTREIALTRRDQRSRETHRVRIYRRRDVVSALARIGFTVSTSRAIGRHRLLPGDTAVVAQRP
jgi:SAM-dependent methyltransferase